MRRGRKFTLNAGPSRGLGVETSNTRMAERNLLGDGNKFVRISPGMVDGEHWICLAACCVESENKAVLLGRKGVSDDMTYVATVGASNEACRIPVRTSEADGGQWTS